MRPSSLTVWATACLTCSGWRASHIRLHAPRPRARTRPATAAARSSARSVTATSAPCSARATQTADPMAPAPPVTSATRPRSPKRRAGPDWPFDSGAFSPGAGSCIAELALFQGSRNPGRLECRLQPDFPCRSRHSDLLESWKSTRVRPACTAAGPGDPAGKRTGRTGWSSMAARGRNRPGTCPARITPSICVNEVDCHATAFTWASRGASTTSGSRGWAPSGRTGSLSPTAPIPRSTSRGPRWEVPESASR